MIYIFNNQVIIVQGPQIFEEMFDYYIADHGMHALGGIRQSAIRDLGTCVSRCTGTCQALDFDKSDNSCWFHTQQSACSQLISQTQTDHYKLLPCADGMF